MAKKIIFVNPPLTSVQRYGILEQAGSVEPPLGLAYLAAITRENGVETIILDAQAKGIDLESSFKVILDEQPDFVGITSTTMSLKSSAELSAIIKEKMPNVKIIVGGCHFTSLPKQTLLENPCFDIGVIGEGEETLEELLKAFIEGGELSLVKGIAFRSNGQIVLTPLRRRIKNLDELPFPAFDLLPELKRYYRPTTQSIKYLPTTSLVTSRGCTGHCLFCDRKTFGNEVRMHSAEYVVDMIEKLQTDFGIRGIIFEEDNFMISERRLYDLSRVIKKRKIKFAWSALSRIDTITEEKLRIAKSCGCWQILYGIESGSQEILDFYRKRISVSQIEKAICLTKKCGIYTKGLFMWGNPLESKKSLRQTRELISRLPLDDISITFFAPYPGADIWEQANKFGQCEKDWEKLTCFGITFAPNGMDKRDIVISQTETLKKFYLQPRVFRSYLTRLRSFSQIKALYRSWRSLVSYLDPKPRKKLLINADDFGLCQGINRGILQALQQGVLGGVSIMPTGYAFKSAVEIAKQFSSIDVGVHLSLTETSPVLPKEKIVSLLDRKGTFPKKFISFFIRYLLRKITKDHIFKELSAQIEEVKEAGIKIMHLDSHQHIHMVPGIFRIVLMLAREHDIPFIRFPSIPMRAKSFFKKGSISRKFYQVALNLLSVAYKPIAKRCGIKFCRYTMGFVESGHLTENKIKDIILSLKNGQYELMCHPGEADDDLKYLIGHWGYQWQQELKTLTLNSIKEYFSHSGVELTRLNGSAQK